MSEEIVIINNELYYRIPNGTTYVYAPIPKEFKLYFDKYKRENKQLKEMFEDSKTFSKQFLYKHNKNLLEANERLYRENKQLKSKLEMYENGVYYSSENDKLKEVIEEIREYNNQIIKDTKDFYRPTKDVIYSGDTLIDLAETNIQILDKVKDVK